MYELQLYREQIQRAMSGRLLGLYRSIFCRVVYVTVYATAVNQLVTVCSLASVIVESYRDKAETFVYDALLGCEKVVFKLCLLTQRDCP